MASASFTIAKDGADDCCHNSGFQRCWSSASNASRFHRGYASLGEGQDVNLCCDDTGSPSWGSTASTFGALNGDFDGSTSPASILTVSEACSEDSGSRLPAGCAFDSENGETAALDASPAPLAVPCSPAMCSLQVRVCSWNLFGEEISSDDDLTQWVSGGHCTDVLVVGVQELVKLKPRNVVAGRRGRGSLQRLSLLRSRVQGVLPPEGPSFVEVGSTSMVGLAVLVFVRKELVPCLGQFRCDQIKTGFGGLAANKGGVCVRFALGPLSLLFANVHLPAGMAKSAKRNQHLKKVMSQAFPRTPTCGGQLASGHHGLPVHDLTVIFGDFNSRLLMKAEERGGIESPEVPSTQEAMLSRDELLSGGFPCLEGFSEGPVGFPPTFGYLPGTDAINPCYTPAWCDRVLTKPGRSATARLHGYDSFPAMRHTSDHRPVAAQLAVSFPCAPELLGR